MHILGLILVTALALPGFALAAVPVREEPVSNLPQWHDFSQRQGQSLQSLNNCTQGTCDSKEVARWTKLVGDLRAQNKLRQIITVNRWFNRLPYKYDDYVANTPDHWADTNELLLKRGDCEDFALSKYYTLRQLGFTPDELQVTVVYDQDTYTNHAVLMVYMDGTRYMLDINADATDPSPMEYRYRTLYSFNENKAWFYQTR